MRIAYGYMLSTKRIKVLLIFTICLLVIIKFSYLARPSSDFENADTFDSEFMGFDENDDSSLFDVQAYFEKRKNWPTSNLGTLMFKNNIKYDVTPQNRTFVILIWRYWNWLKARHVGDKEGANPFDQCSVKNCKVSGDDGIMPMADAVVIHVQHGVLPDRNVRNPTQRWVFLSDESPINSFSLGRRPDLKLWSGIFNWSMTYRSDSDVPVPYGRTVPLKTPFSPGDMPKSVAELIPFWEEKQRMVLAGALISHCHVTKRTNYIKELQKYMDVDVYGRCSEKNLSCPGHFRSDCPVINKYIFYLAFENTNCRQYLTEKVFYNGYAKGAIPVILGPSKIDCENLLPPFSYLHVDDYPSPKDLAEEMKNIVRFQKNLLMYHQWRRHYELLNEHGFFQTKSFHLCRLCEALNYNDPSPKVYSEKDLNSYLDPKLLCNSIK